MASNQATNEQPEIFGIIDVTKSYLYEELWKLCAGNLIDLPAAGSKVYYFPQGQLDYINASTNENLDIMMPIFDLPSKLRCNVVDIQLKAEKDTDEVYAEINLIPDTIQLNIPIPNRNQPRPIVHSFTKILTASDTSTHSGFSIPKRHATECLPLLDMTQSTPSQEILTKDLHGNEWRFKHTFRGTPQRHLFTSGWNAFATAKRLTVGDSFVFLRGENGELRVGIRRASHQQCNIHSSIISTECMHYGVIASMVQAINTRCIFSVMYKPRINQSVINYEKYVDAVNNKFNVGSRFIMRFEDGDFIERRYSGIVVGIQDLSPHWKDSEWRNLEVQWDGPTSIPRPNKVSSWEIEPLMHSSNVPQSNFLKNKRLCQVHEIGSTSSNPWIPTLTHGQEIGQSSMSSWMNAHQLISRNAVEDVKIPYGLLTTNKLDLPTPKPNNNDQMVLSKKETVAMDATNSCRLFGVNLVETSTDSYHKYEIPKLSEEDKIDHNQIPTSLKEIQSKQANSTKNRTKVQMQGGILCRAVDLTLFNGYNPLIDELEKLFDIKDGELRNRNKWEIVFIDSEGDTMLMWDYPWPEFCNMVERILVCLKEDVKKMKSWNKPSECERES